MDKNHLPPEGDGIISLEEIMAEFVENPEGEPFSSGVQENKIIDFPREAQTTDEEEETGSLADKIGGKLQKLRRKTRQYAREMYQDEGKEFDSEAKLAHELLPHVDQEDDEEEIARRRRLRKERRREKTPADTDPRKLAEQYGKGISALRFRLMMVFALGFLQVVLAVAAAGKMIFTLPEQTAIACYISVGLLVFAMVLSLERIVYGISRLILFRPTMESAMVIACLATVFDGLTIPLMAERSGELPYAAVCTVTLALYLLGHYRKRQGQRLACRLAAGVKEPYRVTLDEDVWNGRDVFCKYKGGAEGFGSQIQQKDGAERAYARVLPVYFLLALIGALVCSVGIGHSQRFLWALSACFCVCAPFYGVLAFSSPYYHLTRQLGKRGAALAGWESAERTKRGDGILLTDFDLFPPGMIEPNGIKVFGRTSAETAMMYAHALIAETDGGLERVFRNLLRSHGCGTSKAHDVSVHDGDGLSGEVRGDHVFVGSAGFMKIMGIILPAGLDVPNAVYLAINGQLAAVFALHYTMHGNIYQGVTGLVAGRLTPIFGTRDFNITPAMLSKRWDLPVHKMEFPAYEKRMELSSHTRVHDGALTALLAREGLAPFYAAVSGARRLRRQVVTGVRLVLAGAAVGLVFALYLTFSGAFSSLSAFNLLLFMLLWAVPNILLPLVTE